MFEIFAVVRQNQGNYALSRHIWCHDSNVIWLKQPWLGPCKAEAKHSRSPTQPKLMLWKLNAMKTQRSLSYEKPKVLESRTAKTNLAESSRSSVSDCRRPLVKANKLQNAVLVQQGCIKLHLTTENVTHPWVDTTIRTLRLETSKTGRLNAPRHPSSAGTNQQDLDATIPKELGLLSLEGGNVR